MITFTPATPDTEESLNTYRLFINRDGKETWVSIVEPGRNSGRFAVELYAYSDTLEGIEQAELQWISEKNRKARQFRDVLDTNPTSWEDPKKVLRLHGQLEKLSEVNPSIILDPLSDALARVEEARRAYEATKIRLGMVTADITGKVNNLWTAAEILEVVK